MTKQSRSAITMLLSALKSVYRKAYVKGIASAVVLTAGLSVGAANAAIEGTLGTDTSIPADEWPTVTAIGEQGAAVKIEIGDQLKFAESITIGSNASIKNVGTGINDGASLYVSKDLLVTDGGAITIDASGKYFGIVGGNDTSDAS